MWGRALCWIFGGSEGIKPQGWTQERRFFPLLSRDRCFKNSVWCSKETGLFLGRWGSSDQAAVLVLVDQSPCSLGTLGKEAIRPLSVLVKQHNYFSMS